MVSPPRRCLIPPRMLGFVPLILMLLANCPSSAHAPSSDTATGQDAQQPAKSSKDVSARKRKFEEEKRRLESGGETTPTEIPTGSDQTFFVSPATATMLVGESWYFSSFDIQGKTLTAETEWSISGSSVAEVSTDHPALVTAKSPGSFTVRARIGGRYAEASVTVLPGKKLPGFTIRWMAPRIPGFTIKKVFPAGQSESGQAVTFFEKNDLGEVLLRAFTSNGRQLWKKRGFDLSPRNGAQ